HEIARMGEGLSPGIVHPRVIVKMEIAQIGLFGSAYDADSVFMKPVKSIPAAITGKERTRVEDAYQSAVTGELLPAYRRLAGFLTTEYLPHARETAGLCGIPGGKELYRYLVKTETTSDLSPDEIHALGLREL